MSLSRPPAWGRPTPAVGVACLRVGDRGAEVLLIRRGRPPLAGGWSLPGGRIEPGERVADAALRELGEETGVRARLAGLLDVVDGLFPGSGGVSGHHYVLVDYAALWLEGEPRAGDDAADAVFAPLADLPRLGLWSETERVIALAAERLGFADQLSAGPAPAHGGRA
ncbi:MAG: NUDIX hydrolase [Caulobacteraceae bacterium]|nr:NUDIX hydrolase [Caulobacter sp.]